MSADGGAAFPRLSHASHSDGGSSSFESCDGMTLRDYFAAKALGGIVSDNTNFVVSRKEASEKGIGMYDHFAASAYEMADAMLRARAKNQS